LCPEKSKRAHKLDSYLTIISFRLYRQVVKESPFVKPEGDEKSKDLHKLVMPRLDRGILFAATKEDPRVKPEGDEGIEVQPRMRLPLKTPLRPEEVS
jgi:hypothetical protein